MFLAVIVHFSCLESAGFKQVSFCEFLKLSLFFKN